MAPPLFPEDLQLILQHTRPEWEEARGRRLFMTGGTGFLGCWMAESFCAANRILQLGASLTLLSRRPRAFAEKCPHLAADPALTLLEGDVRSFAFPEGEFPYVIHAATESWGRDRRSTPLDTLTTIVRGTERTLEFAAAHGARKLLFVSSGAVYGAQPPDLEFLPESYTGAPHPLDPASAYGEGKRMAELLCALHARASGFECKIARCFAFVGPHLPLDAHFAAGNFLRDAMRGDSIRVEGDGTPVRTYMYAADLAIWLWRILFRGPSLDPINVGSGEALSIADLAHQTAAALNSASEVRIARTADPAMPPQRYAPCVEKAGRLLGLRCWTTLQEALGRTAAWHGYRPF